MSASPPPADRFRIGDRWSGPDLRIYVVRRQPNLPDHVQLAPVSAGHGVVEHRSHVDRWRRAVWGGRWD